MVDDRIRYVADPVIQVRQNFSVTAVLPGYSLYRFLFTDAKQDRLQEGNEPIKSDVEKFINSVVGCITHPQNATHEETRSILSKKLLDAVGEVEEVQ